MNDRRTRSVFASSSHPFRKQREMDGAPGDDGVGLRIGIELVAGVVVGTVLGLVLDRWLGTKPWLLIVGFLLGSCAGFLNVYRVAQAEEARRKADAESKAKDQSRSP